MKKILLFIIALLICIPFYGCENKEEDALDILQMQNICEMATLECYFHNVAKFTDEARTTFLWMKKDAKLWIEYTAILEYGIDASELKIEVNGTDVTVYLPDAKLLNAGDIIINKDSYIQDKNSAKITAKDEIQAISEAQANMEKLVKNEASLLQMAKENAKELLSNYITNMGEALGKEYVITWVDVNNNDIETESTEVIP